MIYEKVYDSIPGKGIWKGLFAPESVAVVGASSDEKKYGFKIFRDLLPGLSRDYGWI